MQKIVFVSHCVLNIASKVIMYTPEDMAAEEALRKRFMHLAIDNDVQLIQLPCPEYLMYGADRWGHVSNQFDNVFFRKFCRKALEPIIDQLKEYLAHEDRFEVLGVVGIDGSPSCGVDYTCTGDWYGSFEGRENLEETLATAKLSKGPGVLMAVLKEMLDEEGLSDRINMTAIFAPEPDKSLNLIK